MKYVALVCNNPGAFEALSPGERDELTSEADAYLKEFSESGELIGEGFALADASTGRTVRVRNGLPAVTDGPFAEAKEQLAGFYVLDAESLERAAEIVAHDPAARFWAVDTDWPQILALYELLERMSPNPMVTLNHAVAVAMLRAPRPASTFLALSTKIAGSPGIIAWMRSEPISWRWPASARPLWPVTEALHAVRQASPNDATSRVERLVSQSSQHDNMIE